MSNLQRLLSFRDIYKENLYNELFPLVLFHRIYISFDVTLYCLNAVYNVYRDHSDSLLSLIINKSQCFIILHYRLEMMLYYSYSYPRSLSVFSCKLYVCILSFWLFFFFFFFGGGGGGGVFGSKNIRQWVTHDAKYCMMWNLLIFIVLTHLLLDKMAAISQMMFSDASLWLKSFLFWLEFHWRLFPRVQLIIIQHW